MAFRGRIQGRNGRALALTPGVSVAFAALMAACGDDAADGAGGSSASTTLVGGTGAGSPAGTGAGSPAGTGAGSPAGTGAGDPSGTGAGSSTSVSSGGVVPPAPACEPVAGGGSAEVATPALVGSLGDRWHEGWLASPAVADLDGDGTKEILASRHGLVLGWHLDGTIVFRQEVEGRCWASPVVADLRPDLPGLEVAQSSDDAIWAWGSDGQPLPGFPFAWRGELRSLAAGDIDGNGDLELVAVTTQNLEANGQRDIVIAVHGDGSIVDGFPPNTSGTSGCDDACYVYNGYDQNIALGDVDGDDVADIFATQDNAYNSLHRGDGFAFDCAAIFEDKTKFHGVRGMHDYAEAQQGYAEDESTANQAHHTNTAPAIADIDGDGVGELVYVASVQNAAQDDRERGVALWVLENDGTRSATWQEPYHAPDFLSGLWDYGDNVVAITNQVTVAEVFPDRPGPEMFFAGFDGFLHAVGSDKQHIWSFGYTSRPDVATGGVVVADLSGDGVPEIVFATYSTAENESALFVLDAGGNELSRTPLPRRGAMPVPTIDDVEGDGQLEIVVSLKGGEDAEPQVLVYTMPGSSTNCLLWPTGRGNYRRDGWLPPG